MLAYDRLEDAKASDKASTQKDESIDELASALLEELSQSIAQTPVPMSASSPNLLRSTSGNTVAEDLNKALPPLPQDDHHRAGVFHHQRARTALSSKATRRVSSEISSRAEKRATKLPISSPVGPILHTGFAPSAIERVHTPDDQSGHTAGVSSPETTTADAAELSEKISNLIKQANEQNKGLHSKPNETANSKNGDKLSTLSKSKRAFTKAKQAVVRRFSSSAERQAKKKDNDNYSLFDTTFYDRDADIDSNRINRRIAEGHNLSSPKVRSLTGDGNVPRKALPVYDSIKSLRSNSPDDPFSDDMEMEDDVRSSHVYSTFDSNPSRRETNKASTYTDSVTDLLTAQAQNTPKFSDAVSGLAQHPDVDCFSSSPLGHSTPRIRLEPRMDSNGKKRLTGVLDHSPSITNSNFVACDEGNMNQSLRARGIEPYDLRLKRKRFTTDLRPSGIPLTKKAKKGAKSTMEDLTVATGIGKLDMEDACALASKDTNRKIARASRISKGKGLGIFDTEKGEAPMTDATDMVKKPRGRLAKAAKRSSIPKPVNHTPGYERRAITIPLRNLTGDDSMGVDELQMDVSEYHIGGRRG